MYIAKSPAEMSIIMIKKVSPSHFIIETNWAESAPGKLICCSGSGCIHSFHKECVGLDKIPDNDYYCDKCIDKKANEPKKRTLILESSLFQQRSL